VREKTPIPASAALPSRDLEYAEGTIGAVGTAPVVMYDADSNVVGSAQAQFLTDVLDDSDCNTPEGLTRANWSDTLELFSR